MHDGRSAQAAAPRIVLIHALMESMAPAHVALAAHWPEAVGHDLFASALLDGSPGDERSAIRIRLLLKVAQHEGPQGVLFTCSAFGGVLDAIRSEFDLRMVHPTEAAIWEVLGYGRNIVAVLSTAAAESGIATDFERYARMEGCAARLQIRVANGALAALRGGQRSAHDEAVMREIACASGADAILLPQFSTAHIALAARGRTSKPIVTAPAAAVRRLRNQISTPADRFLPRSAAPRPGSET